MKLASHTATHGDRLRVELRETDRLRSSHRRRLVSSLIVEE